MTSRSARKGAARQRVGDFEAKFGKEMLHLAYHAALPVALDAGLLHFLRINFFWEPSETLPPWAESDLLLSSLCHEVDDGLYEIESDVRDVLLEGLVSEHEYGHKRIREIATLLWQYSIRHSPWVNRPLLERAQQLTALNFLDSERALRWLEEAENQSGLVGLEGREWFVAMREEVKQRAETLSGLIKEPVTALAKEMRDRQAAGGAPYVLLLGSSLSLTPEVRRAICGSDDWETFWTAVEKMSPAERRAAFKGPLERLLLAEGYRALTRLLAAGYFEVVFTLNVDDTLDDELSVLKADEYRIWVYGEVTSAELVAALEYRSPRVKVLKLRGDVKAHKLPLIPEGQFEFPRELENAVTQWLSHDTMVVGDLPFDDDVWRCLRGGDGELWVVELETSEHLHRVKQVRQKGEMIAAESFNAFFTALADDLEIEEVKPAGDVSSCFDDLRQALQGRASEQGQQVDASLTRLVEAIRQHFRFGTGDSYMLSNISDSFSVFSMVPFGLESILPNPFPLIILLSQNAISQAQIDQLKPILNQLDVPARFAVLIALDEVAETRNRIRQRFGGIASENIVVLGEREILNVLASTEVHRAFMRVVQQQVALTLLSPYQTVGPTTMDMLYGRKNELAQILKIIDDDNSVAVLGARRIGKTSFLIAASRAIEEQGKVSFYLGAYAIHDYETLLSAISTRWKRHELDFSTYTKLADYYRLVDDVQDLYPGHQIVFLFDDIDWLLAFDRQNDEILLRMFRSMAQQKRCQFIFSGERMVLDSLNDPQSSFFNFTIPIYLGLLDRENVERLFKEPMELIGVRLQEPVGSILSLVFEYTAGHPNLIQSLCEQILKELSRSKVQVVTPELVQMLGDRPEFRERYLEIFWSQADPFEKAMSVLVAERGKATEDEIFKDLQGAGFKATIGQLYRGLRYLIVTQLLAKADEHYFVQPSKFYKFLSIYHPFSEWLQAFLEEWKHFEGK